MVCFQFRVILILCLMRCNICNADSIPASLYCTTRSPYGLIVLDLTGGTESRLLSGPVIYMMQGRNGYIAASHDKILEVFHYKKRLRVIKNIGVRMIGWLNNVFVFSSDGKIYSLEATTGKVRSFFLNSNVRWLCKVNNNILAVEERETYTFLSLFNLSHRLLHQWKTTKGKSSYGPLIKENRWVVLETFSEKELTSLWIVDTYSNKESYFGVNSSGLVAGNKPKEILIGSLKTGITKENSGTTQIISLNLDTLKTQTIAEIAGDHKLIGLSRDDKWMITQTFNAEVGPGQLNGIRISDKKMEVLRYQVDDCILITNN